MQTEHHPKPLLRAYQSPGNNKIAGLLAPARRYVHMLLSKQVTEEVSIHAHNGLMQRSG